MKHISGLDSIRGIAVLMVIGYHYTIPGFSFGLVGVDIFFVLSGFLITSILTDEWEKTEKINFPRFYLRRGLRLLPALAILLVVVSLRESLWSILATLFYMENWATAFKWLPTENSYLLHTWSLSIEEQFYLVWPLLLFFLIKSRIPRNRLFLVPLLLAFASNLTRATLWFSGVWGERIYRGTDTHSDGIFLGCALALILAHGVEFPRLMVWTLSVITGGYFLALWTRAIPKDTLFMGGFFLVAVAAAIFIALIANSSWNRLSRILANKPLVLIGQMSYGLYLWHVPVFMFLRRTLYVPNSVLVTSALLFTMLIAGGSYWLIERPILRLKDRHSESQNIPVATPIE
jgi:peptidoglycan/LPS O-acetylase OafA/YrhL